MQIWDIVGVCYACDWDEDMEETGMIRAWYETKLNPDYKEPDWVELLREREIIEEREQKIDEKEQKKYEKLFGY